MTASAMTANTPGIIERFWRWLRGQRMSVILIVIGIALVVVSFFEELPGGWGTLEPGADGPLRVLGAAALLLGAAAELRLRKKIRLMDLLRRVGVGAAIAAFLVLLVLLLWPRTPVVTAVGPEVVDRGEARLITIIGENFSGTLSVSFGGEGVTAGKPRRVSSKEIEVSISVASSAFVGPLSVSVTNADGRSGSCGRQCFRVRYPLPRIASTEPARLPQGAQRASLKIIGENFDEKATVSFSRDDVVTVESFTRLSETLIDAVVSVPVTAPRGRLRVSVENPEKRSGACEPDCLAITLPPAEISEVQPSSLEQGAAIRTLKVTGRNFDENVKLAIGGPGVTMESVNRDSETELTVVVTLAHTAPTGSRAISVANGDEQMKPCTSGCFNVSSSGRPACATRPLRSQAIAGTGKFDRNRIAHGTHVEPVIDPLTGSYSDLAPGTAIWVLVYPHLAEKYYQQTHRPDYGPATLLEQFRSSAAFGGGAEELYDVVLVFATPDASAALQAILRRWAEDRDFKGLRAEELPLGLDEKDCVVVTGVRRG